MGTRCRAWPLTALPVLAGLLAGCASDPARAADGAPAAPQRRSTPSACSLVSVDDVSLYVALAGWDVSSGEQDGRGVCRYSTRGYTVTTVTMRLAEDAEPPPGLCSPPGSTAAKRTAGLLCGYSGPGPGTATEVAAGSGYAVGVRVVGPDARRHATLLAQHALSHL